VDASSIAHRAEPAKSAISKLIVAARGLRTAGGVTAIQRYGDAGLVRRSLAGDAEAARELHRHYLPIAICFLRKLGTRPDELEDAGQEVFLQFFRYLGSFRGEAEIKTWLYRLCISEARRVRRRRKVGEALAALLRREPPSGAVPPVFRSEATVEAMVRRALDRMQPEQRRTFIRFEVEGLTGKQVATLEGRSLPATFRRLYEAQRVLQETFGLA
jgi:RNA polymerase sigma-70 factor (ECF subfamily)